MIPPPQPDGSGRAPGSETEFDLASDLAFDPAFDLASEPRTDPGSGPDPAPASDNPLVRAVAEVEEFAAGAGWDAPRQMFALVRTGELLAADPALARQLVGRAGVSASHAATELTPIAQEPLPGESLTDALATITWPDEVAGCALVLEILAGAGEKQAEARLVAGVLRDRPGGACLMRWRHAPDGPVLRGPDLAPGLLAALQGTFEP